MQIDVVKPGHMATTGRSLLRILQASSIPPLDLLVRESIQNCLDAARPAENEVHIDFNIRQLSPDRLNAFSAHLPEISESLLDRYADRNISLEIRDSNTVGLTGALQRDRDTVDGNFLKLVYDVSVPRDNESSGGSWGLGKTCYYSMGIGLVVYYSRVRLQNDSFQSRLVACLVESKQREHALLASNSVPENTGIAWWGALTQDDQSTAVTDERSIRAVIESLGVDAFEDKECGTSVILPFLRQDLTESHQIPQEDGHRPPAPWGDLLDYNLSVAIQRWYAPRLNNPSYGQGPALVARVNSERIQGDAESPLARTLRQLYQCTPAAGEELRKIKGVECAAININKTFAVGRTAGWIAWTRLSPEEMGIMPPANRPHPITWMTGKVFHGQVPPPILGMIRSPGLIVRYAGPGEDWLRNLNGEDGRQLIALFVLAGASELVGDGLEGSSLEAYVRASESAKHDDWIDPAGGHNILERIKRGTARILKAAVKQNESSPDARRQVGASQFLGQLLLPAGFGEEPTIAPGSTSRSNSGRCPPRTVFTPLGIGYKVQAGAKIASLQFAMQLGPEKAGDIEVGIATDSGKVSRSRWAEDGLAFPFEILSISVRQVEDGNEIRDRWSGLASVYGAQDENGVIVAVPGLLVGGRPGQGNLVALEWSTDAIGLELFGTLDYSIKEQLMALITFKPRKT